MSISVKGVSKYYGSQKALDNISFDIKPGEIVGFLGPNGAGKSTMMKIITCYIPQSEGSVSVCGYNVGEQAIQARKHIGYLPEHNPLYLEMYIKEYLHFVAGIYKLPKKNVQDMIDLTGLGKEQHKKIGALSKGYRQRVGLAQALIHQPDVLILDEPTTGLDPNQLVEIRQLIKEVGKEKTVMLSTHIMQEVEAICDRVMIINNGQIVTDTPTEHIGALSQNKKSILIGVNQKIEASFFNHIHNIEKIERLESGLWRVFHNDNSDIREELFNKVVQSNLILTHLEPEEKNLEDVFQQLTR